MKKIKSRLSDNRAQDGTVTVESLENLFQYRNDPRNKLNWECLFTLPSWLNVWWALFGKGRHQLFCSVRWRGVLVGLAPLMVDGKKVHLIGDADLCDYGDFIVVPGLERQFLSVLIPWLKQESISCLDMGLMRKQSSNLTALCTYPEALGYEITREQGEVVYHLELPGTWEEFFPILSGKERHELRRKMRRLSAAGRITYQVVEEKQEVQSAMDTFIRLFRMNRPEKSRFMNSGREKFFRMLAEEMAKEGILKLFFLEIDGRPAASVMCFDYGSTVYLYNNGYDNHFETLSVGLLCKVFSIKHSIERGKKKYDFLKGGELYKSRLGSTLSQLVRCQVKFI
jgi:CelD/BcsL family acetyltransferase involved in cellulose biosynthesis